MAGQDRHVTGWSDDGGLLWAEPPHALGKALGFPPQPRQQHGPERLPRSGDELREVGTGVHQPLDQREHLTPAPLRDEPHELALTVIRYQATPLTHLPPRPRPLAHDATPP